MHLSAAAPHDSSTRLILPIPQHGAAPTPGIRAAHGENPCSACTFSWCDAPWSSGRTGCPACAGRGT